MTELRRALNRVDTTALAVGTMIGTGILLKPAVMAQEAGSPALLLLAWVAGGAFTLLATLTYSELGALFPRAGGEYVFLREAFGAAPAFVFGLTRYAIGGAAAAAYGVAFATFLAATLPLDGGARKAVAVGVIAALTAVNCAGVLAGGRLQTVLATAKTAGLLVLVGGLAMALSRGAPSHAAFTGASLDTAADPVRGGAAGFGAAVLASVWAYAGWFMVPMAAGEVKDPRRTLPWALTVATLLVVALYLLVNVAFLVALPFGELLSASSTRHPTAPSVANTAAAVLLGAHGAAFASVLFPVAVVGSLNGTLLAIPRIPFAMARDGDLPAALGRVGRRSRVPVWSVALLGAGGIALATTGTFDQLTTAATFFYCVGFAANAAGVLLLRRRRPTAERPFRVATWVPPLFLAANLALLANTVRTNPREVVAALALMGVSAAAYVAVQWRRRALAARRAAPRPAVP
jgi:APA family basic amino acid/polyamine antiporter